YDVDLDSVEDKPWRKPGADITDYFNYGFNKYTWKAYCTKQKQMRKDQHAQKKIHVRHIN
ncbi:Fip1 motif-domain-containing protein, partial [Gigaspora rosea]